jgi:hypothetical protein
MINTRGRECVDGGGGRWGWVRWRCGRLGWNNEDGVKTNVQKRP